MASVYFRFRSEVIVCLPLPVLIVASVGVMGALLGGLLGLLLMPLLVPDGFFVGVLAFFTAWCGAFVGLFPGVVMARLVMGKEHQNS